MALELLAWSKALSGTDPRSLDIFETEHLVDRGGDCYRRLLSTVHGDRDGVSLDESDGWLAESRSAWRDRPEMIEKGSFLRGPKLRLTGEDFERLDRLRPERSFSAPDPAQYEPDATTDVAGQLERLGALRAGGVLTEAEFRAAKARVLG
jgi:hypothetical protein